MRLWRNQTGDLLKAPQLLVQSIVGSHSVRTGMFVCGQWCRGYKTDTTPRKAIRMISCPTGKPGSPGMPWLEGLRVHCVFPLSNGGDWGPERRRDLPKAAYLAEGRPEPGFLLPGLGCFPELCCVSYFGCGPVCKPAHLPLEMRLWN